MKYRSASVKIGTTEISVTVGYMVLWTGEDFEVTVVDPEPPDNETPEYLERFNVEALQYIPVRVNAVLRRLVKDQIDQYIVMEDM